MLIRTLWVSRRGELSPELLEAWDEFSIDENPEGFARACEAALARAGSDVREHRYINLRVRWNDVLLKFGVTTIDADVV